jgi:hypothetical protein
LLYFKLLHEQGQKLLANKINEHDHKCPNEDNVKKHGKLKKAFFYIGANNIQNHENKIRNNQEKNPF